jgi:hypothetical protein
LVDLRVHLGLVGSAESRRDRLIFGPHRSNNPASASTQPDMVSLC